jgi:hypothetical protein
VSVEPVTYAEWKRVREKLEQCPWAGPRPLREEDEGQFIGREDDVLGFLGDVFDHSLVILEAESGVGKSSLLKVGLMPELKSYGYQPLYCDRWAVGEGAPTPDEHLASVLAEEIEVQPGERFIDAVNHRFGARAVVILDQFEELIRYDERFFEKIGRWLVDVVRDTDVKIVLSLRSEYAHRLRALQQSIGPWGMARCILEPISAEAEVQRLLQAPQQQPAPDAAEVDGGETPGRRVTLDDPAETAVLDLWKSKNLATSATGMLRLHSLLYALHGRLDPADEVITAAHVAKLVQDADERETDAFALAMEETVSLKMDLCERALGPSGGTDRYLCHGTRGVVEEIVQHLASGGYKLVRERWDLAQRALDREIAVLFPRGSGQHLEQGADRGSLPLAFDGMARLATDGDQDFLTATWGQVVGEHAARALAPGDQPWEVDGAELSSGAMLAMDPDLVAIEEVRRFTFALKWLEDSSLVRITSTQDERSMISLVHDGFGTALEGWVEARVPRPLDAICRLTASKGDDFGWIRDDGSRWPELEDAEVVNVRWQFGVVRAAMRRVRFVNCDLRGTRFEGCTLEGVQFLNCILDGVTFRDCRIVGKPPAFSPPYPKRVPPCFEVPPHDVGMVGVLARYRGHRGPAVEATTLISHTSGLPAVPCTPEHHAVFLPTEAPVDGQPWRIPVPDPTGGVAMYGGRLCSLALLQCHFDAGAFLALGLVSGTALDVVECTDGTVGLDIYGAAIRGLTITGPVGDESASVELDLHVDDAVLAGTWIGPRVQGKAAFERALLWELLSLAARPDPGSDPDPLALAVTFKDCGYFGLVNVGEPPAPSERDDGFSIEGIADLGGSAKVAERQDFQSDPALAEFERRRREATPLWPAVSRAFDPI